MKTTTLNNGAKIPQLGLGLWRMKDQQECEAAVLEALKFGYRHFDTAQIYGNEAFLGSALKRSNIKRADIFVTTKISTENMWWVDVVPSFEESLQKLQTSYVDLLLLHFPVTELRRPAWERMEELAADGRAKAIGVSNYTVEHLKELLSECSIKPAVNQVELHVYLQQPELIAYCKEQGIVVEAYSPLAHGNGIDNKVLAEIGKKHNKSSAQIMLRWCLEVGTVPLPKTVHVDRIKEDFEVFDFALDADDLKMIAGLNKNYRTAWDPTHVA